MDKSPKAPDRVRIVLAVAGAWLVLGLLNASRLRVLLPEYEPDFGWKDALIYGMPDVLFWAVLSTIPIALARRFPIGPHPKPWLIHAVAAVVVIFAHGAIDSSVSRLAGSYVGMGVWAALMARVTEAFYANLLVYALVVGITQNLASTAALREERRKTAELDAQLAEAKLQALRMQIRPHFVMNALNTVAGQVGLAPEAARTNLRRLGDLMRASTSLEHVNEVPLHEEIEFARNYLELEQSRFADRLNIHFDIEPSLENCLVPVFLLQPLVENSVVHGIAPSPAGGTIHVDVHGEDQRLVFEVRDDGKGFDLDRTTRAGEAGAGIGLPNVRRRLQALYASDHDFEVSANEPRGTRVTISIPRRSQPTDLHAQSGVNR